MKDLLKELDELDEAIAHATEIADVQCDKCAQEHRRLAEWLTELLEIKRARLAVEVFQAEELPEFETFDSTSELPLPCPRCGSQVGMTERGGKLVCSSCGATYKDNE